MASETTEITEITVKPLVTHEPVFNTVDGAKAAAAAAADAAAVAAAGAVAGPTVITTTSGDGDGVNYDTDTDTGNNYNILPVTKSSPSSNSKFTLAAFKEIAKTIAKVLANILLALTGVGLIALAVKYKQDGKVFFFGKSNTDISCSASASASASGKTDNTDNTIISFV